MCLWWQVAIVHNVLMLTKCQFDPWDWWGGRGCGSWILKQATVWCSCGDGQRHDTDETSDYLPNGRHIQGRKGEKERWKGPETVSRTDEGVEYPIWKRHKGRSVCYLSSEHSNSKTNALFLLTKRKCKCLQMMMGAATLWGCPRIDFLLLVGK